MPDLIRFHLDEHVANAIAEGLRRRGFEVTTAVGADLLNATDEEHLAFASSQGRVMVTYDSDYLRLHQTGIQHEGIAYCEPGTRTLGQVLKSFVLIGEVLVSADMHNHVEYL
jgi:hypothetical protein